VNRILVAGVGNELFGDDGFGVAVVQALAGREVRYGCEREGVKLMNAGTRGFDLVTALSDGYEVAILIDAMPRGRAPGTLYVLDATPSGEKVNPQLEVPLDPHGLEPARALALARAVGAPLARVYVVGCEPAEQLEMSDQLSAPVAAAVEPALREVERLIEELWTPEVQRA
jgi:hydrogenase maturation protease